MYQCMKDTTKSYNLLQWFEDSFITMERIGIVASKLQLHLRLHIYLVFHISLLKKYKAD